MKILAVKMGSVCVYVVISVDEEYRLIYGQSGAWDAAEERASRKVWMSPWRLRNIGS